MRSMRRAVSLLAVTACALVTAALPATAHTGLIGSTPTDGERVTTATEELVLVFGDDLAAGVGQIAVRGPDGAAVLQGPLSVRGDTVRARMRLSRPGVHQVSYRLVAADGHPVEGGLRFRVRATAPAAPSTDAAVAPADPDAAAGAAGDADAESEQTIAVATAAAMPADGALTAGWQLPAGGLALAALLTVGILVRTRRRRAEEPPALP